jgi:hypothetical protein
MDPLMDRNNDERLFGGLSPSVVQLGRKLTGAARVTVDDVRWSVGDLAKEP